MRKNNLSYIFSLSSLLIISAIFKIKYYLMNGIFSGDESNLVIPLLQHHIHNILFQYNEVGELAPPFFFFIQKTISNIFGINEYSLRILPLLASILSTIIFTFTAQKFLKKKLSIIIAVFLFSINMALFEYSAMFKPYSTDVLITTTLIYLCVNDKIKLFNFKDKSILNILCTTLFFSFLFLTSMSAIFIIPALLLAVLIKELLNKSIKAVKNIIITSILNFGVITIYYYYFLSKLNHQEYLHYLWKQDYGFFPNTHKELATLFNFFFDDASYWGITNNFVIACMFLLLLLGLTAYIIDIVKNHEKNLCFSLSIILIPILGMLLAGALGIYPFQHRIILFLLPLFIILISKNFDFTDKRNMLYGIIAFCLLITYFIHSNIIQNYKAIFKNKILIYNPYDFRHIYKELKAIDNNKLIVVGTSLFLQVYVYNHIYNFKPKNILMTNHYPGLSTVKNMEYINKKINNEDNFYILYDKTDQEFKIDKIDSKYPYKRISGEEDFVSLREYTKPKADR